MGKLFDRIRSAVREDRFLVSWHVYPADCPSEACPEPAIVRWLDEVARHAEAGDLEYLQKAGRVFQAVVG